MWFVLYILLHCHKPENWKVHQQNVVQSGDNSPETHKMLTDSLWGMRVCPKHKHFHGVCIFERAERMWKMTFTVDNLL
jgi:hypothetical protein